MRYTKFDIRYTDLFGKAFENEIINRLTSLLSSKVFAQIGLLLADVADDRRTVEKQRQRSGLSYLLKLEHLGRR